MFGGGEYAFIDELEETEEQVTGEAATEPDVAVEEAIKDTTFEETTSKRPRERHQVCSQTLGPDQASVFRHARDAQAFV